MLPCRLRSWSWSEGSPKPRLDFRLRGFGPRPGRDRPGVESGLCVLPEKIGACRTAPPCTCLIESAGVDTKRPRLCQGYRGMGACDSGGVKTSFQVNPWVGKSDDHNTEAHCCAHRKHAHADEHRLISNIWALAKSRNAEPDRGAPDLSHLASRFHCHGEGETRQRQLNSRGDRRLRGDLGACWWSRWSACVPDFGLESSRQKEAGKSGFQRWDCGGLHCLFAATPNIAAIKISTFCELFAPATTANDSFVGRPPAIGVSKTLTPQSRFLASSRTGPCKALGGGYGGVSWGDFWRLSGSREAS
jgi:hypothetical protein